jgi:flagellar motor switch protein FliN
VNANEALLRLGESTAAAVASILEQVAPGSVERGSVAIMGSDADPLADAPMPAVVAAVSYVDGVTGGNLFVVGLPAARRLAAAMKGEDAPDDGESGLSELELSAVSEAANQMLAAAAAATSEVLGEEVEIGVAQTRLVSTAADAEGLFARTPHATQVSFNVFGQPCRLLQLVPNPFVVRLDRALAAQSGEILNDGGPAVSGPVVFDPERLRGVSLRVWAELGRAQPPVGKTVGLGPGSVLELDRNVDDPVDLFVNGRRFGAGRLLVAEDGEWAVQIEQIEPGVSLEPELAEVNGEA